MKDIKTILFGSITLLVIILYVLQSYQYITLMNSYENILDEVKRLKEENQILKSMLMGPGNGLLLNQSIGGLEDYIEGNIVAVSIDGDDIEGLLIRFRLTVEPGEGNIFVAISPHIGFDLQESLERAKEAAGKYLSIDMSRYDIYLIIDAPQEVGMVDGPSAGLMLSLAIVSAFIDLDITGVCVTGSIDSEGYIYQVGGILEKAIACVENGVDKFLVPEGGSKIVIYERVERTILPWITFVTIEAREVDLKQYLEELGYQIDVYEVSTLGEAIELIIGLEEA